MIRIEENCEYEAVRVRSGSNDRGDWEMIVVKPEDKKGRQEINIYPDNKPSGVIEGGRFVVNKINAITLKAYKDARGQWGKDRTGIEAIITPTAGPVSAFRDIEDFEDLDELGI